MTDQALFPDFLSSPRDYPSDHDTPTTSQPIVPTLYAAFSQRPRNVSPSPLPTSRVRAIIHHQDETTGKTAAIDLRCLEYNSEYDPHLMCPICHIPFVDPVVLECDHTFCASCFEQYAHVSIDSTTGKSQCPTCRTPLRASARKASRLISNMCNDIKVHCPNEMCTTVVARSSIETHVEKDCLEQILPCPGLKCDKFTKRKNYIPLQCVHDSHVECDCGALIELGRGQWLTHKDEICPLTRVACGQCGETIAAHDEDSTEKHECLVAGPRPTCPGEDYGCQGILIHEAQDVHAASCPMARMAPFLNKQNRLLNTLSDQVMGLRTRNDTLEVGIAHIDELLATEIQPRLDRLQLHQADHDTDVEEIERDHIPSGAAVHHRDLLLPAHIRDLTPSPTMSHMYAHQSPQSTSSHQHFLSLHESLRANVTTLENEIIQLNNNLTEVDARSSMQLMNETLRLKEDLAHVNAAVFSTRAQVQWLLNRERMNMGMMRGRMPGVAPTSQNQQQQPTDQSQNQSGNDRSGSSGTTQGNVTPPASYPGETSQFPLFPTSSAHSSTSTSPVFGPVSMSGDSRRPTLRRTSGGSQERVKL